MRMKMTTKKTRSGTYGSAYEEEDTLLAQICKSFPLPAFVSKTPRHGVSSPLLLSVPGPEVWKTLFPERLNLHTVVWEKGCYFCSLFLFSVDERMAGLINASFSPYEVFATSM